MSSVNKAIILGRLGRDPESHATQAGGQIVNMSVATEEKWKDKNTGEQKKRTEWHRVVIFNEKLAEIAMKYLKKGSQLYVEGQIATRKWTDNAGVEKYTTEIVVPRFGGSITLLGDPPGQERQGAGASTGSAAGSRQSQADLDDNIPF